MVAPRFDKEFAPQEDVKQPHSPLKLEDGSRVAVMGGGPAGSLFTYFLLEMAERVGIDILVDVYEPRDFSRPAPHGCNMCGGIISESLVQNLATEGINLPANIVQRGIDSYCMHMDVGEVHIDNPLFEKRIAAVYRGSGPKGIKEMKWGSFDGHLQSLSDKKGARIIDEKVTELRREDGQLFIKTKTRPEQSYELLAVATGVNTAALKLLQKADLDYKPPQTTKTAIREYLLGAETIEKYLGSSMHVFLLDIPRLTFAAIIPKGDYVTVCLLGDKIDSQLLKTFLNAPEVKGCMPPDWQWDKPACQCSPRMNVAPAPLPYGDQVVFLGDCGVTRLYKDGIGAAYRAAKAAASTAVFHGISAEDFRKHYLPACRKMTNDNRIGMVIFWFTKIIQRLRFVRRAILAMAAKEQESPDNDKTMSMVLWDMFTGSAPYREIFLRTLHPVYLARLFWHSFLALFSLDKKPGLEDKKRVTAV